VGAALRGATLTGLGTGGGAVEVLGFRLTIHVASSTTTAKVTGTQPPTCIDSAGLRALASNAVSKDAGRRAGTSSSAVRSIILIGSST
jgi:hypothetical protein